MRKNIKPKNFKKSLINIFIYLKKDKYKLIVSVIFAISASILILQGPNILTKITDTISNGLINNNIDLKYVYNTGLILLIIYIISYILSIANNLIMTNTMQNMARELRTKVINKLDCLPMSYYSKNSKGDILSRVTNDIDTLGQSLQQSISALLSSVSLFIGSIIMMFITNIVLAITAILSTLIGFILMSLIMSRSQKYFKKQQKLLGDLNGHIEEMYSGHTIIKAYNAEDNATQIFNDYNIQLKDSSFIAQSLSGLMMPIMQFIGNFGYVAVCIVGALLVINNNIEFGIIVAFMIYIRLFTQPLGQIAQSMQNLQSATASSERIFEFLQEDEQLDESHITNTLVNVKGDVEFKNVNFAYTKGKQIINNFSAIIKQGQKVAIVGPTGAGKTTLVNLLMRFYEIDNGDILIDNMSIKKVKRENIHSLFSMVLQDTWLFEGTLKENLIYTSDNNDYKILVDACKAVGLDHFINTLPNGYDTIINDTLQLSLGQKQQITIARAIIANKPMIILDEATSSIDTRTEQHIQQAMDKLMENRTSFVIAHRLSTIKNADLILVVNNGDIIEKGTHKQLLENKGFYANLYNSQFDKV